MSNEHLSQVGQSAVDQTFNGDGFHDEGPLDPSVFFGLFDDLDEDPDPAPDPQAEPVAEGDPSGDGGLEEQEGSNTEVDTTEVDTIELDSPEARQADTVEDERPPVVAFTPIRSDRSSNRAGVEALQSTAAGDAAGGVADTEAATTVEVDREATQVEVGADTGDGGGTMAKVALATIGIGLFAGLIVAFVLSLRSADAVSGSVAGGADGGDPAASTVVEEAPVGLAGAVATGTQPTPQLLADEFAAAIRAAMSNRLDLTSLRFEPGTTELDARSAVIVTELGALLAEQPAVPVTISVRTYTESTPAGNLDLSSDQADAIAAALVAAGAAPDQIRSRGLGSAPLSQAEPVPNFVALTPQFGDRRLDETLAGQSPFAFGLPATATDDVWPLRPDGLLAIGETADTLSAYPDAEVGAAGYSFLPPSQAGIRTEADTAAAELADFLVTAYGIDSRQVTTIIPGSAVFVPTPEHGNHIWLQTGPASQGAFDVASVDPAAISFEPGSADLDAEGVAAVRALADILTAGGATVVVNLRSYEAADAAADQALSEARSDTLESALLTAGVAPEQLRMYASGASSYLLGDGGPAITMTVAP